MSNTGALLTVIAIIAIAGAAWAVLSKIDPMAGEDHSGLSPKNKAITIVVLVVIGGVLLAIKGS